MTLLLKGDFPRLEAVAARFMRCGDGREDGRPLRFAKHICLAAVFSRAVRSVASVQIEDEDGTVFAGDLERLAGVGALVEQVETRIIHGCTLLRRVR